MSEAYQGVNEEALRLAMEDLQTEAELDRLADELGVEVPEHWERPWQSARFMVQMYQRDKAILDAVVARRKSLGLPMRSSQRAVIREAIALLASKELGATFR